MTIAPARAASVSLGVAAIAGGVGLGIGTITGLITAIDDGSIHHSTRYGYGGKTDAASREAARDKIEGERHNGILAAVFGGVLAGAGLFTHGYTRAGLFLTGGAFLGMGAGTWLQLRDSEEKIQRLPSEADLPPRAAPWHPTITVPGRPGPGAPQWPTDFGGDAGRFPTLTERLAAASADAPPAP
jgi:hypothetical protein